MAKFIKGQSGNPKGRPKGMINHRRLREAIVKETPEIIESMIGLAKAGDTTAAKILLDRVIAPMRSGDAFVHLPLEGKMTQDARNVLQAIGSSQITTGQGQALLSGIASLARIVEIDELLARVEKLESANGKS
jgi:hypothetical protein